VERVSWLRRSATGGERAPPPAAVEIEIETRRPRLELRAAADGDALPLARQALRALGRSIGVPPEALHDAELALTEACANVVCHAYRGTGTLAVAIEVRTGDLLIVVRDHGRGMPARPPARRAAAGGLGLAVMEAISSDIEVRSPADGGTEVLMAVPTGMRDEAPATTEPPARATVERVVRRLVAVAAAQADMAPDRIAEALIAVEIVARHAPSRLVGDTVRLRLDSLPDAVELSIGPLEHDGTTAVLEDTDMPIVGSIVERLADEVWAIPPAPGRTDGEELALRFAA
jgi:serine/threonine-protein kinase RsbW